MGTTSSLPAITNRQQDLLRFIYKFRFLNRSQIQTLMGHRDKRLINVWLKDLSQKSYLVQEYSKRFPENTKPAIYSSNLRAIRYFKSQELPGSVINRLYRDRTRTQAFISSKLFLADIAIQLKKAATDRFIIDLATSSDNANPQALAYFLTSEFVSPDAIFTILDKKNKTTYSYIIEIIPSNYPIKIQYSDLKNYLLFLSYERWERKTGLNPPKLLLIFMSNNQLRTAKQHFTQMVDKSYRDDQYLFNIDFILASQITKNGLIKHL